MKLTYAVKANDGQTGTDNQTVTANISGTNDAPDIHLVTSDSATASLTETNAPLTASGTLAVIRPGHVTTVETCVLPVSLGGTTGGLTSADVLGMLSLSSASLAADPTDTH